MKKTLIILTVGLLLTGCSAGPPGPANGYTGQATIDHSYRNSRKSGCKVVIKLPDGRQDTLSVGRRTDCTGWDKGKTISINQGRLVKQ